MVKHSQNAKEFLRDTEYANWHNEALWYVRAKRDSASKSIPKWEELRENAQKIKEHTLKYLKYYLLEFEKNCIQNGIEIYWAKDANEHNQIVLKLLKEHNVKSVVKSKSMLTEECELNPYLEQNGIEVVDTDLGERIVQLALDHPSHIVLPAIHMKKEEVSQIFTKYLDAQEGNSDPVYLTHLARSDLRKRFLNADAAITGVNFALAKEGGFVVCTNEGNADLGTSLPPLHIAVMGIEKVIPSTKELGIFTRLLARSATGQAITTYTTHFLRPQNNQRVVVVIVDNGRTKLYNSKQIEALQCIRCGACMNTCPVYRRSGGHSYESVIPGPIGSVLYSSKEPNEYGSLAFACSLCASCDMVCPAHINLHHQLLDIRKDVIELAEFKGKKRGLKVASFILKYKWLYNISIKLLKYMPKFIINSSINLWAVEHNTPSLAKKSFSQIYKEGL